MKIKPLRAYPKIAFDYINRPVIDGDIYLLVEKELFRREKIIVLKLIGEYWIEQVENQLS